MVGGTTLALKLEQTFPDGQNGGLNGSTKRTDFPQIKNKSVFNAANFYQDWGLSI